MSSRPRRTGAGIPPANREINYGAGSSLSKSSEKQRRSAAMSKQKAVANTPNKRPTPTDTQTISARRKKKPRATSLNQDGFDCDIETQHEDADGGQEMWDDKTGPLEQFDVDDTLHEPIDLKVVYSSSTKLQLSVPFEKIYADLNDDNPLTLDDKSCVVFYCACSVSAVGCFFLSFCSFYCYSNSASTSIAIAAAAAAMATSAASASASSSTCRCETSPHFL